MRLDSVLNVFESQRGGRNVKYIIVTFVAFFIFGATAHSQVIAYDPGAYLTGDLPEAPENLSLEDAIDMMQPVFEADEQGGGLFFSDDALHGRFEAKGADCSDFIDADGVFGPRGHVIASAFKQFEHLQVLISNQAARATSMPQLCPKFARLSEEERIRFWVWTFAAIAWDESTCKYGARNSRATNGTAVGLLQMETNLRARSWRGPLCRFQSVASPRENLLCGLEIMRGQFSGLYSSNRSCKGLAGLSMPCSYWQKLRRNWSPVHHLITLFPGCK